MLPFQSTGKDCHSLAGNEKLTTNQSLRNLTGIRHGEWIAMECKGERQGQRLWKAQHLVGLHDNEAGALRVLLRDLLRLHGLRELRHGGTDQKGSAQTNAPGSRRDSGSFQGRSQRSQQARRQVAPRCPGEQVKHVEPQDSRIYALISPD